MTAPNPGPGWTEVDTSVPGFALRPGDEFLHWAGGLDGPFLDWVLTPPKPLPTAAGTVIRGSGGAAEGLWILDDAGWHRSGDTSLVPAEVLQERIGGFEVVSVDAATTAAAVLADVVARGITTADDAALTAIAEQYGATSPQP